MKREVSHRVNWGKFAASVNLWMRNDGLNGHKAAVTAGVAPSIITRARRGQAINRDNFLTICRALQSTPETFLEGDLFSALPNAAPEPNSLKTLELHLRGAPNMPAQVADALMEVVRRVTQQQPPTRPRRSSDA